MSGKNNYKPRFIRGLWALTVRELKKWVKEPIILMMAVLQPVIWMTLFGKSMDLGKMFSPTNLGNLTIKDVQIPGALLNPPVNGIITIPGELIAQQLQQFFADLGSLAMQNTFGVADYFSYMAVGMISMIVIFSTMFSGMSIVWDRRLGFLSKVLSTPVSRAAIIMSKMLNAALRGMFQATIILALAAVFGLKFSASFTPLNLLGIYLAVFLMSMGLSAIFVALALRSTRQETQMAIVNLINMPLMFASNTFYPISLMPEWIQAVAKVNPITYLTDAIRQLTVLSMDVSALLLDLVYLSVFAAVCSIIGVVLSWRYITK
ncbi:ABC transporter permease [Candidatus Bathyarchaeota archaeon]|nr:ABC transporter permease [Candidatus Bathyarchaeota archaeon]